MEGNIYKEEFEDTKRAIRICRGTDNKCPKEKSTTIYNIIGPGWLNELGSCRARVAQ
jgi:hypothetical protein